MIRTITDEKGNCCKVLRPIGNYSTGTPMVECPNCKRKFAWYQNDKTFFCECGAIVCVDEGKTPIRNYFKKSRIDG